MTVSMDQVGPPIDPLPLLRSTRTHLATLLADLDPSDWDRPTPCPGWDVTDLVCHLLGDDLGRLARTRDGQGRLGPSRSEDLPAFIERINAEWVTAGRRLSARLLVDLLGWTTPQVLALWEQRDPHALADGVSWAGVEPAATWFDGARDATEYWLHEQQLREAVGLPRRGAGGGQRDDGDLAAVLDILARGLPHALAAVPSATGTVLVSAHGGTSRRWLLERRRHGRWHIEPTGGGRGEASTTVSCDADELWRRWIRHPGAADLRAAVAGDGQLARAVLDHVAIIRRGDPSPRGLPAGS